MGLSELCNSLHPGIPGSSQPFNRHLYAGCIYLPTLWSRWTAARQFHRDISQQKLVLLVITGELLQAGEGLLDPWKPVLLILNDETVFIIQSKRSLWHFSTVLGLKLVCAQFHSTHCKSRKAPEHKQWGRTLHRTWGSAAGGRFPLRTPTSSVYWPRTPTWSSKY